MSYENSSTVVSSPYLAAVGYLFHDVVRFWTRRRLTPAEMAPIAPKIRRRWLPKSNERSKWKYHQLRMNGWQFFYQIEQPNTETFRRLHEMLGSDVLINYLEVALELNTDSEAERQFLANSLRTTLWQGNKSKRERRRLYLDTVYTGSRKARNYLTLYADRHSKITGEVFCTKLEYRVTSAVAVRQKHVHTFADLVNFDHDAFWLRRLKFSVVDLYRLELGVEDHSRLLRDEPQLKELPPRLRSYKRAKLLIAMCETEYGPSGPSFEEIKEGWRDLDIERFYPLHKYEVRIPLFAMDLANFPPPGI